jgi:hypothetical protein
MASIIERLGLLIWIHLAKTAMFRRDTQPYASPTWHKHQKPPCNMKRCFIPYSYLHQHILAQFITP